MLHLIENYTWKGNKEKTESFNKLYAFYFEKHVSTIDCFEDLCVIGFDQTKMKVHKSRRIAIKKGFHSSCSL